MSVLGWLRECVGDLGAGTTAGLGLVAGVGVGALVTLQVAAGGLDTQADLDRAAARPHARVPQPAGPTPWASGKDVTRLEQHSADLSKKLQAAQGTIDDLRQQIDDLRATPAATAPTAPTSPPSEPTTTSEPSPGPDLAVRGTLETSWVLSSRLKPWPSDCSGVGKSYRVRVNNGDHATVAIGTLTDSQVTKRVEKRGVLTLTCRTPYQATLPAPVAAVYEFQTVSADDPDKALDVALVKASEIHGGQAPEMFVTFCPECSRGRS